MTHQSTPPETVTYPGARLPDRAYRVDANGVGIAVAEWGKEDDPVLMLVHGGFDFAATYDVFAPKIADRGFRVVAWDQRGHGDSDHARLDCWDADRRDMRVRQFDGGDFFCHTAVASRKPDTLDGLAKRRQRINPRLSVDWLRYLVTRGGRLDADGWRWKLDPSMRFGGFGPWRPEWAQLRLPGIGAPFLGVLVTEQEEMGWGTTPDDLAGWVPPNGRIELVQGAGHFVHIEQPDLVLDMVMDFLGCA